MNALKLRTSARIVSFFFGLSLAIAPVSRSVPIVASFSSGAAQLTLNSSLDSLDLDVLVAIGMAEGTRTADGGKNSAWYGHIDPGNGALNQGSCSWQSSPVSSPEEADALCLQALEKRAQTVPPGSSPFVLLSYLDAWVQSPSAAADFFKLLSDAPGETEFDRVLYARVRAFIDPATGRWDAPGLGNSVQRISDDQRRRLTALQKYLWTVDSRR